MKLLLVSLFIFIYLINTSQAQVKFRVKKLNADSLVALITEKEEIEIRSWIENQDGKIVISGNAVAGLIRGLRP